MTSEVDDVVGQLRVLARLVALQVVQGKTQVEAIRLLGRTGLDRKEIALAVGTNPEVVSVRLAEAKRSQTKRASSSMGRRKK